MHMLLVIISWTDLQEISRGRILHIAIQEKVMFYFTLSKDHSVQTHGNRAKQWIMQTDSAQSFQMESFLFLSSWQRQGLLLPYNRT